MSIARELYEEDPLYTCTVSHRHFDKIQNDNITLWDNWLLQNFCFAPTVAQYLISTVHWVILEPLSSLCLSRRRISPECNSGWPRLTAEDKKDIEISLKSQERRKRTRQSDLVADWMHNGLLSTPAGVDKKYVRMTNNLWLRWNFNCILLLDRDRWSCRVDSAH